MPVDLDLLRNAREAIWLAELGALLHNVGKMHPWWIRKIQNKTKHPLEPQFRYEFVGGAAQRFANPSILAKWEAAIPRWLKIAGVLASAEKAMTGEKAMKGYPNLAALFRTSVDLPVPFQDRKDYTIGDILDFQDSAWYKNHDGTSETWFELWTGQPTSELTRLFKECHEQASGGDKRSLEREWTETITGAIDDEPDLKASPVPWKAISAFGYGNDLTEEIHKNAFAAVESTFQQAPTLDRRDPILQDLRRHMKQGLADPRPPINDVRVSDMGFAAAAFFKAAIAGSILQGRISPIPQWRMVRFCFDGEAYLEQANRISDLSARESSLTLLRDAIRRELETNTPIANEIYRDTQGVVYLLPFLDSPDLDRDFLDQVTLLVERCFHEDRFAGQELSTSRAESLPFALGPQSGYSFALGELLDRPVPTMRASPEIAAQWNRHTLEVCAVCGIRPISSDRTLRARRICETCHRARVGRCKEWRHHQPSHHTIWIDELADQHGRVALISARFRLGGWLTADNYIGRTFVVLENSPTGRRMKSPSFARLARIFETTRDFWADATPDFHKKRDPRLLLNGTFQPSPSSPSPRLSENVAYILDYGPEFKASVLYVGKEPSAHDQFILVDNPSRLSGQLPHGTDLPGFLSTHPCLVVEPTGYGSPDKNLGAWRPAPTGSWGPAYTPSLQLLNEPSRMWLLCPAENALEAASKLYSQYLVRMAKVRNRLPLDIGIVYFPSSTPVRTAIDAARRFSRARFTHTPWDLSRIDPASGDLTFANGLLWQSFPNDRFFANFEPVGLRCLADLSAPATVRVEPSHFDFVYLDQSSARFELVYRAEPQGTHYIRRGGGHRPHPLERLPDFDAAWAILRRLSTSQIKALDERLQLSPELWPKGADETYRWFARAALANARWPARESPTSLDMDRLVDWASNGVLEDVIEIRLGIEKQKGRPERSETHSTTAPKEETTV